MQATPWMARTILGATLCGSTYTSPTTLFLSYATSCASDGAFFLEEDGSGYERTVILFNTPTGNKVTSSNTVTCGAVTAATTLAFFGIHDAFTSGNLMYWGPVDEAKYVGVAIELFVPAGQFTVRIG